MTYKQKLLDPRWQKKRLEVLTRDSFTCVHCLDSTSTLHVHHKYYTYGMEPWDYPLAAFATLCLECHESEGWAKDNYKAVLQSLLHDGYSYEDLAQYLSGLQRPSERHCNQDRVNYASYCAGNDEALDAMQAEIRANHAAFIDDSLRSEEEGGNG